MSERTVGVGIIGSRFVAELHAAAFQRVRGARLAAAASPNRDHVEEFAKRFGIPRAFTDYREMLRSPEVDLVCLAGWLHLLPIPADFRHRVLNIHPSLLPAFGGKGMYGHHVHEAVLEYGAKVSGCTAHYVDDQYDHGAIIAQRAVDASSALRELKKLSTGALSQQLPTRLMLTVMPRAASSAR